METPYEDELIQFKRRIYLAALIIGLLALLSNWWVEVWRAETMGAEGWVIILMTLTCLLLLAGLISRRLSVAIVESLLLLGVAASLLADLAYLLFAAPLARADWLRNLADLFYWFPLVPYFLSVVQAPRRALYVSLGFLGALFIIEAVYLLRVAGQPDFAGDFSLLGRFFLAFVIYLMFGAVMARVKDLQIQSRLRAREMEILAYRDHLTGIPNRRILEDLISLEIARAGRIAGSFSVILLDVDHFKEINDGYGHAAGDATLIAVAQLVESDLRAGDQLGRWGGDEFLILSNGTERESAGHQADRIRGLIRAREYPHGQLVTVSIGVAEFRPGEDSTALIARADEALYRAKAGGRDLVVVAT